MNENLSNCCGELIDEMYEDGSFGYCRLCKKVCCADWYDIQSNLK